MGEANHRGLRGALAARERQVRRRRRGMPAGKRQRTGTLRSHCVDGHGDCGRVGRNPSASAHCDAHLTARAHRGLAERAEGADGNECPGDRRRRVCACAGFALLCRRGASRRRAQPCHRNNSCGEGCNDGG